MRKISSVLFLLIVLTVSMSGCLQKERIYKNRFVIAGTFVEVLSPDRKASKIVLKNMRRMDKIFNLYDKKSSLSKVNKNAGIAPVKVEPELIELIKLAQQLYKLTDKAFDPSIGKVILFWKQKIEAKKLKTFPAPEEINDLMQYTGMRYIEVDEKASTVFIKKKGLIMDLGGIAKGYMIDKSVQALQKNSIDSALINAGGDIYCLGKKGDTPWNIGIKDPKKALPLIETIKVFDEAIATSGDYEQFSEYKGVKYSHIIDPKTGFPVQGPTRSVTVIAHNATTADGFATAFFVMGRDKLEQFLQQNKSNMKIFVVEELNNQISVHCLGPFFPAAKVDIDNTLGYNK